MVDKFWEPVAELEFMVLDSDCEPMKDDPDVPQDYGCVVIGFNLSDPEGCLSILNVAGYTGREADEEFAKLIIEGLQAVLPDRTDNGEVDGGTPV